MKSPLLYSAIGVLVTANTFVLIHADVNRSGAPDAELELTARELKYYSSSREDSGVSLLIEWQNPAAQFSFYGATKMPAAPWFDVDKLKETGFDVRVPPASKDASRYYMRQRSRQVFVALEFDGPAWREWLNWRKAAIAAEPVPNIPVPVGSNPTKEDRFRIEEETTSRLVAMDVGLDPSALRAKHPDRQRVMILRGRATVILDDGVKVPAPGAPREKAVPFLRGAITSIDPSLINVPQPLSRKFEPRMSYSPWTYSGDQFKVVEPPFSVTLRIGSQYEPWVVDVKPQ
jgi:uncharacterized protein DUF4824